MITPIFANFDTPRAAVERFFAAIRDRDPDAVMRAMGTVSEPLDPLRPGDRHLASALLLFFAPHSPLAGEPLEDFTITDTVRVPIRWIDNGVTMHLRLSVVRPSREWLVEGFDSHDPFEAALERLAAIPRQFDA